MSSVKLRLKSLRKKTNIFLGYTTILCNFKNEIIAGQSEVKGSQNEVRKSGTKS